MTAQDRKTPPPELWGGAECTIVRLQEEYRDQAAETGHLVLKTLHSDSVAQSIGRIL